MLLYAAQGEINKGIFNVAGVVKKSCGGVWTKVGIAYGQRANSCDTRSKLVRTRTEVTSYSLIKGNTMHFTQSENNKSTIGKPPIEASPAAIEP